MNIRIFALIVLVIASLGVGFYLLSTKSSSAPTSPAIRAAFDAGSLVMGTDDAIISGTASGMDQVIILIMNGERTRDYLAYVDNGRWSIDTHYPNGTTRLESGTYRIQAHARDNADTPEFDQLLLAETELTVLP